MHLIKNHWLCLSCLPGRPQAAVHPPAPGAMGKEELEYVVASLWDVSLGLGGCQLHRGWGSTHNNTWTHSQEHPQVCMTAVWTPKCHLPNCSNSTRASCKLKPGISVAVSPVYVCPKKSVLASFPTIIPSSWSFLFPSAGEDISVKLTVLKYSWQRGVKLQLMLISVPHSCVFSFIHKKLYGNSRCCSAEQMKQFKIQFLRTHRFTVSHGLTLCFVEF